MKDRETTALPATDDPVVLSVAFPYAPVGAHAVGGAEVICSQLEAELASFGFRSLVVAHAASAPRGQLYGTHVPSGTITDEVREQVEAAQQENIDRALRDHHVALVHMHGLDFHRYRIPDHIPVLVTLHLPPSWYPETIWTLPANYHLVCVSETQRRACPASAQGRLAVIENGVPLPARETLRGEGRYALMLARICPEKNLHVGLDAARLAGMPALLGGEVFAYEAHQRYFHDEIEPRLTRAGATHDARLGRPEEPVARFLGPVSADEKTRVLSRAACLLLPSLAPETSSLVAMEALAAGVPVIGMAVGAVPEIVESGRTGFLIEPGDGSVQRLAEAIRRLPEINRALCRTVAEERFPLQRMLDKYCETYRQIARPPAEPKEIAAANTSSAPVAVPPPAEQDLIMGCIVHDADLQALESEWAALWQSDPTATPFQHPAWLLPWWRQFGPDGELDALQVREKERLVAFTPLYRYVRADGSRQTLLIGAGTTDYLDGVWSPRYRLAAADAVMAEVQRTTPKTGQVSLFQLRPESAMVAALERAGFELGSSEPTSVVRVAQPLPAKLCANIRRYGRRAQSHGEVSFTVAQTEAEALQCFEHLRRFQKQRWDRRDEDGVLSDGRVVSHHRESLPRLQRAGLLHMFSLSISGDLLGVLYALGDPLSRQERRLYLYLIGFNEDFADLSPGTLLLHEVWRYARERGFAALDLLRGGESYKQLWGAESQATFALELPLQHEDR